MLKRNFKSQFVSLSGAHTIKDTKSRLSDPANLKNHIRDMQAPSQNPKRCGEYLKN